MNKKRSLYIILGLLALLVIYSIVTYNVLVKKEENVKLQWNEVQNAYQRRLDLIPNLVSTVRGGAEFEQTVLQKIASARVKAAAVQSLGDDSGPAFNQQEKVQNELAAASNKLLAVVENYPTLKGTRAFRDLQTQLEGTERRIRVARKDFNGAIATYNSSVKSFPTSMVAGVFGFRAKEGFQSEAGADKSVEINFKP